MLRPGLPRVSICLFSTRLDLASFLPAPSSGISPFLAPSFAHVYIFCLCLTRIKKKKTMNLFLRPLAEEHLFLTQEDRIPPPASMGGISELGLS